VRAGRHQRYCASGIIVQQQPQQRRLLTKVLVSNIAQKIAEKVSLIPISILWAKSIGNSHANTTKVLPIVLVAIPMLRY